MSAGGASCTNRGAVHVVDIFVSRRLRQGNCSAFPVLGFSKCLPLGFLWCGLASHVSLSGSPLKYVAFSTIVRFFS